MSEEMQPHEPVEGEYTDAELPLDAELPKGSVGERDDVDDDDVIVEEVEYVEVDEPGGTPI